MIATGIVRKIDYLGRLVIPMEIRKTHRIGVGDPIEIFTGKDGMIVFRKYSPVGADTTAKRYAYAMNKTTGHVACVCDRDTIVAVAGTEGRRLMGKTVSEDLEDIMQRKESLIINAASGDKIMNVRCDDEFNTDTAQLFVPIITEGEAVGCVMLLSQVPGTIMGETERIAAMISANMLGQ